jgi:hypothetical protein
VKGRRADAAVSGPAREQGTRRAEAPSDPEFLAELCNAHLVQLLSLTRVWTYG